MPSARAGCRLSVGHLGRRSGRWWRSTHASTELARTAPCSIRYELQGATRLDPALHLVEVPDLAQVEQFADLGLVGRGADVDAVCPGPGLGSGVDESAQPGSPEMILSDDLSVTGCCGGSVMPAQVSSQPSTGLGARSLKLPTERPPGNPFPGGDPWDSAHRSSGALLDPLLLDEPPHQIADLLL
jgi:hypothetical protein